MASIDQEIKSSFESEMHRLLTNVVYTSSWFKNLFDEFYKEFGLSTQQSNILRILRGAGDWKSMNDIKAVMVEKSPNATRLADKLIAKELVERNRSESDRRVVYLRITKKGLDLLDKADKAGNPLSQEALESITDEEARLASRVLDKIRG